MTLKIGSLCSGFGGLDLAVEQFFNAETAWFSEFDKAPSKVLAHHWPDVPNLGDMTKIDWATVPKVDIVTGGTPCQDLSGAGQRKGMTEGTRSNLWVQMRECIAIVQPQIVVWENVRGAYSARADCSLESCEGCVGDSGHGGPFLRALGRVLGDLSELGFDAEVVGLRASDAGAPHPRFRVFVVAYAQGVGHEWVGCARNGRSGPEDSGPDLADALALLPTPDASVANDGESVETWEARRQRVMLTAKNGNGMGTPLTIAAQLFPTPSVADSTGGHATRSGARSNEPLLPGLVTLLPTQFAASVAEYTALWDSLDDQSPFWVTDKGVDYWPAIARWTDVLGRKAPSPTIPDGKGGRHRLNPAFVEWMIGALKDWICSTEIDLTRNEKLKACGNGVVMQQAVLALSIAWPRVLESLTLEYVA